MGGYEINSVHNRNPTTKVYDGYDPPVQRDEPQPADTQDEYTWARKFTPHFFPIISAGALFTDGDSAVRPMSVEASVSERGALMEEAARIWRLAEKTYYPYFFLEPGDRWDGIVDAMMALREQGHDAVPLRFRNAPAYELDVQSLLTDSVTRGEFALKWVRIKNLARKGPVILHVPEIESAQYLGVHQYGKSPLFDVMFDRQVRGNLMIIGKMDRGGQIFTDFPDLQRRSIRLYAGELGVTRGMAGLVPGLEVDFEAAKRERTIVRILDSMKRECTEAGAERPGIAYRFDELRETDQRAMAERAYDVYLVEFKKLIVTEEGQSVLRDGAGIKLMETVMERENDSRLKDVRSLRKGFEKRTKREARKAKRKGRSSHAHVK